MPCVCLAARLYEVTLMLSVHLSTAVPSPSGDCLDSYSGALLLSLFLWLKAPCEDSSPSTRFHSALWNFLSSVSCASLIIPLVLS